MTTEENKKKQAMVTPQQSGPQDKPKQENNVDLMHMLSAMLLGNSSPVERYNVEELLINDNPTSMEPVASPRKV